MLLTIGLSLSTFFYLSTLLIHILIIYKVIPYQKVNGGRSKDYQEQLKLSITNMIVVSLLFIFIGSYMFQTNFKDNLFYVIALGVITVFRLFYLILQLLGTEFEKLLMLLVVL